MWISTNTSMRLFKIVALLALALVATAIAVPAYWQWSYRARLLHAMPTGSSREDYSKALWAGHLGSNIPRLGYTFSRPLQFHGIVYTIYALPQWGPDERLIDYRMCPGLS